MKIENNLNHSLRVCLSGMGMFRGKVQFGSDCCLKENARGNLASMSVVRIRKELIQGAHELSDSESQKKLGGVSALRS